MRPVLVRVAAALALSAAFVVTGCAPPPRPVYVAPPPPPPPLNYQAIEQQGVHDGFEAARHDVETGRPPAFASHPRFRRPPVPPPGIPSYRAGFRRGYEQYLHQAPPPPPPPGA